MCAAKAPMDGGRWEKMQALFHEAADLPKDAQQQFLKSACGGDEELMADLTGMLEEDQRQSSLVDRGLGHTASHILAERDAAALVTQPIGPYRVLRVVGEGGMGVVYLAERKDLESIVAIKVLRDAWLSPARRQRFAREQKTLAQLNHPGIAHLYDADTLSDSSPYIVMEYVEGVPLTEYCKTHECSLERRLQLFRQVCEAVQYAHSHAVIHRDLKPSNILVKQDGSVRLLDFGIAKHLEDLDAPVEQTMTGLRLMTPAYAAPEQIRGDRVGIHTDVYSLGVILFELLTGELPFDLSNLTPAEAATVIAEHEPGKPSSIVLRRGASSNSASTSKSAWDDLDVLCLTALHKDIQRRYRSVEALIRDLDHYLQGEPLEARPDTFSYKLRKFIRRNQRSVVVSAATVLLVLGLVVFFTIRLEKARDAALAEAARTERVQQFMLNLFRGGDEAVAPSDSLRVLTLVDRGVQEAKTLNTDPKIQAELYENLGAIYQKLGKFNEADSLLQSALEQRKSLFGPNSPEVAETLVALGLLRTDQAQLDEAEGFAREGLDISQRRLAPNHPTNVTATFALGKVLEARGRYQDAIEYLDRAVRLRSESGPSADLAASVSELANAHFYAGHYDVSDALNRRALAMQRQIYGDRHPVVADTLINLGAIQFQAGHYAESEHFNRQALDIVQAWYGNNHPETADTMTILGQSLTYQNRFDEAAVLLRQSLSILEHVYGPVHPRVAYALNELGQVAIRQGKLDDAEADFSREVSIYRTVYHDQHYLISIAMSNLAGVYASRKQYARAEELFRDALQRYDGTLPPDHLNVGIGHARLGNVLAADHHYVEAEAQSRAGYQILMKQKNPTLKWLQMARTDLAQEYEALHQLDKAQQFRAEAANATDSMKLTAKK
ncbi:MAG TPA: serine/threonine-protein kinase [Terriglobales bacterium]|nr:serine/threonine-protein kinase [Terriglobales bacterium]